ncbi:MAG: type 4a pilus biogenesis protein PilO, partial [Actinomycetota bacterium]
SARTLIALAVGGVLLYGIVVWFLVLAPKRSEAATLRTDIAAAELELAQAQETANRPHSSGASIADVFRLAKAMPASTDQPGLVLELDRLARASGVTLGSIAPQDPVYGSSGATLIPVEVIVDGTYRQITSFLARARQLVTVRRGMLNATGRLFTVQGVELSESSTSGFPRLDGIIKLNAYVYDGPIASPSASDRPGDEVSPPGRTAQGATS